MIPQPFFYQLVVLGLLWLFVMLHYAWPSRCVASPHQPAKPILPPRKHSSDPQPFSGLTRRPLCAACEHAPAPHPHAPAAPPPRLVPTRGRPRQVDTSSHFCPHPHCAYRGWLGLGNISANGHPNGGPWRQRHCTSCDGYFQETHGTPLHGKRVPVDLLVWTAIDPVTKLLLTIDIGDRTLAMAQRVVHQVVQVLAPGCVPLFLTDGFKEYATALLTHFGHWVQPPRRQVTGPTPKPRWMPRPQLLYAQVVKTVRRRRLVRVRHRIVFGTREAIQQVLAACGWQINTAFVERVNLTIRQHVAAVRRRVTTLCKREAGLRQQLGLYH